MTFTPIGPEQTKAYRIASYLRRTFTEWTAEPLKPGQLYREPFLRWNDDGARDGYRLICSIWRLPIEA